MSKGYRQTDVSSRIVGELPVGNLLQPQIGNHDFLLDGNFMSGFIEKSVLRRRFVQLGLASATLPFSPLPSRAYSPNSKLQTAHIGIGGMGASDLKSIAAHPSVEVAALCDVDRTRLTEAQKAYPTARTFVDYREMLDALADSIDAVVVSTPDHTHAPAALAAMMRNKPVYCQKPLTHQVGEARRLRELAQSSRLVTQMGIQVHSTAPYRRAVRIVQSGALGKVSRVYVWSAKNWGYDGGPLSNFSPPPPNLEWDLWLGVAQERPYVEGVYHPSNWRRLVDFGTGTLGDMGVHIFDTPFAALQLTAPSWVRSTCRPPTGIGHPERNVVEYEFPGTDYTTDQLRWVWFDGTNAPPSSQSVGLPESFKLPRQGALLVGEEGTMLLPHVAEPELFPQEKFQDYSPPEVDNGNHYFEWVDACRGMGQTSAGFDYAGPLTEALLLGVIASRYPDQELHWDFGNLKIPNLPEAEQYLNTDYRSGFNVPS
jgi:predicted dehydrogenase